MLERKQTIQTIKLKYRELSPVLHERSRRLWAATEAKALGRGGIAAVMAATGLAENTIRAGLADLVVSEFQYFPSNAKSIPVRGWK